jgi:hypothetical protein
MDEPFLTLDQVFSHAIKADSNLKSTLFLEQVVRHIADGVLHASGLRFWEEARYCPSGANGTEKTKTILRALEPERADIPPHSMVDYRPIFERGPERRMIGLIEGKQAQNWSLTDLIEGAGGKLRLESMAARPSEPEKRDGWADVRLLASDVERLWPRADAIPGARKYKKEKRTTAVTLVNQIFPDGVPESILPAELVRTVAASSQFTNLPKAMRPSNDTILRASGRRN